MAGPSHHFHHLSPQLLLDISTSHLPDLSARHSKKKKSGKKSEWNGNDNRDSIRIYDSGNYDDNDVGNLESQSAKTTTTSVNYDDDGEKKEIGIDRKGESESHHFTRRKYHFALN